MKKKVKEFWNRILPFTFINSLGMGILKIIVAIATGSVRIIFIFFL